MGLCASSAATDDEAAERAAANEPGGGSGSGSKKGSSDSNDGSTGGSGSGSTPSSKDTSQQSLTGSSSPSTKRLSSTSSSISLTETKTPDGKASGGSSSEPLVKGRAATEAGAAAGESKEDMVLLSVPFFSDIDRKHARELRALFTRTVYTTGQLVVAEAVRSAPGTAAAVGVADATTTFHVVISGGVRLTARAFDAKEEPVLLSELRSGDWFGDMGRITSPLVQAVTATAIEADTVILALRAEQFHESIKRYPDLSVAFSVSWAAQQPPLRVQLKKIPFFSEISDLKLQVLGTLCSIRKIKVGTQICAQGDEADGFYAIIQGRVEVSASGGGAALSGGAGEKTEERPVYLDTLAAGDWFGEIALLERTTRTATVVATQDGIMLYLARERFEAFLRLAPELAANKFFDDVVRKRTANSLKAIPIFSLLKKKDKGPMEVFDEKRLAMLGSLFKFVQHAPGDSIFQEGDAGDAFYIIVRGKCRVTAKSAHNTVAFLNELKENDYFGENSLLGSARCTATVTATNKVMVLRLRSVDFKRFLSIAPELEEPLRERIATRTAERLKKIPFFAHVRENKPWSKLDLLGALFVFEIFNKGDTVFREGSVGDKFYVVVTGMLQASAHREGVGEVVLAKLEPDLWFGEIALMKDTTRTATVSCMTDCVLISVTAALWKKFLNVAPELAKPFQTMLDHRTANILKSLPIFKHVHENRPWNKLEMLSSMTQYITYATGDVIYRKGDVEDKFYTMLGGKVQISDGDGKTTDREEVEFFGENALFKRGPRQQTATAVNRVSLMYFTTAAFKRFLRLAPELRPHFETMVAERSRVSINMEELLVDIDGDADSLMPPEEAKAHAWERLHSAASASAAATAAAAAAVTAATAAAASASASASASTIAVRTTEEKAEEKESKEPSTPRASTPRSIASPSVSVNVSGSVGGASSSSILISGGERRAASPSVASPPIPSYAHSSSVASTSAPPIPPYRPSVSSTTPPMPRATISLASSPPPSPPVATPATATPPSSSAIPASSSSGNLSLSPAEVHLDLSTTSPVLSSSTPLIGQAQPSDDFL